MDSSDEDPCRRRALEVRDGSTKFRRVVGSALEARKERWRLHRLGFPPQTPFERGDRLVPGKGIPTNRIRVRGAGKERRHDQVPPVHEPGVIGSAPERL